MRTLTVQNLIDVLEQLEDKDAYLLVGDEDKYGRNDLSINKVMRKLHGFDEDNAQYYVLCVELAPEGCFKF